MLDLGQYTSLWGVTAYFLIFFLGLIIGSFLNSIIWRLWDNIAIFARTRSICVHCRQQLSWKENIPLFSYLMLRGKCLHCHRNISKFYPWVEFITAVIITLVARHYLPLGNFSEWSFLRDLFFVAFLVVIFIQDLRYQVIFPAVVWSGTIIGLIINISFLNYNFNSLLLGAILGGGFFGAQYLLSKGQWIGGGDVRMGIMMGVWLGWQNLLVALFIAYILGAVVAVILLTLKKAQAKTAVPFGTFLAIGTLVALYWGTDLINWYLSFLR
jgi:prepilin signal peptidase PulO-like enzyme (type II secretory pathway)